MVAYEKFHDGEMSDYIPSDEELAAYRAKLPKMDQFSRNKQVAE